MKSTFSTTRAIYAALGLLFASSVPAAPPPTTVEYQPMVSTGLAAKMPFEAWFVFDKSLDSKVTGYEIPAGAKIRFTFPGEFTPETDLPLIAVMIRWTQGAIPVKFATTKDSNNPRVIEIKFAEAISASGTGAPGMKAIHLRTPEINPQAGDYPVLIEFIDAGPLTGETRATAKITPAPVPNIAPYNQLHANQNEDWQRVKPGAEAPLPINFLVTMPEQARNSISLKVSGDDGLIILSDGKRIGSISTTGAKISVTPRMFGPGYARLGIIELQAKAGTTPGIAQIVAKLDGGTQSVINLVIE
ncbi:MAG: hypothetical protein NTV11_01890 [Rhodocyclales bacterium]|nr:hypothetical protein [Rhodocyclales bacterium]